MTRARQPAPHPVAVPLAVALHQVTVVYGRTTALREVSLQVRAGERVGLLGPSGAGKSTLLGVLTGSVPVASGQVAVLGSGLDRLSRRALRRLRGRIGTVHQQLDLVGPLRVVHNVNAGRLARWSLPGAAWSLVRPSVDEALAALARVGLEDRLHDRTDEFSGGQQQRVAVARLLVQDPELLLADEPVSSLDPALAAQVLDALVELSRTRGRTLIASLHEPAAAVASCDRLVGLRDGRVVLDVAAEDLEPDALDELYRRQA